MTHLLRRALGTATASSCVYAIWTCAALADSEPPPPDTVTESGTGTLVVITLAVVAIVLVSVVVLRGVSRSRRGRWIDEEHQAKSPREEP